MVEAGTDKASSPRAPARPHPACPPPPCPPFFFNDTATTEIYTLSLHDALPISGETPQPRWHQSPSNTRGKTSLPVSCPLPRDRKSTRLNSSHGYISYAVFCLKKKKQGTVVIPYTKEIKPQDDTQY